MYWLQIYRECADKTSEALELLTCGICLEIGLFGISWDRECIQTLYSIYSFRQRMSVVQEVNFPPVNGQFPVASLTLIKDIQ